MTEYDERNRNRGAIWKNTRKENERQPDFTGSLDVNGAAFFISAWRRDAGASPNSPALRISITPKDNQHSQQPTRKAVDVLSEDFKDDDSIPF